MIPGHIDLGVKHFALISHIKIADVLPALTQHAALWDLETWRQDHPLSPHTATRAIFLRMPREITLESVINGLDVEDCPAMQIKPFAKLAADMAAELDAGDRVARIMLTELRPNARIKAHRDEGAYADATERYHLPIITNRHCIMQIGNEAVHMEPGDVWWFDKHIKHAATNFGLERRVHMIMDLFR